MILLRKFHGKGPGSWSETNVRQLYQDTHHLEQCGNYKIDDIRSAQERVKGIEWDFKMPPKPRLPSPCSESSLEYVTDQEEAHLQVSGVAIEPEQNYYEDEQRSEPESRLGRRTNCVEQAVVYSTLPQEYSTLTFGERLLLVVVEWGREAK